MLTLGLILLLVLALLGTVVAVAAAFRDTFMLIFLGQILEGCFTIIGAIFTALLESLQG